MAPEGHGLAFVPGRSVQRELESQRPVLAAGWRNWPAKGGEFGISQLPAPADTGLQQDLSPPTAMRSTPIIADRAEFVEALRLLRRGHILVRTSEAAGGCVLDGGIVYRSYDTLVRYGLIDEFDNPHGFPNASYYRITERGRDFADRAWESWRSRPLWQRLAVRLAG